MCTLVPSRKEGSTERGGWFDVRFDDGDTLCVLMTVKNKGMACGRSLTVRTQVALGPVGLPPHPPHDARNQRSARESLCTRGDGFRRHACGDRAA